MDITISPANLFAAVTMILIITVPVLYAFKRQEDKRETRIKKRLAEVKQIIGGISVTAGGFAEHAKPKQWAQKLERAKRLLDKILDLHPTCPIAMHYYAIYHLQTGNDRESEKIWKDAVISDFDSPIPHTHLGNLYFGKKEYDKAALHYKKAIQIDKNFDPPRVGMGNIKYFQGKIYSAMGFYSLANKINSQNHLAMIGLGNCYRKSENFEKALECYERAFELDSTGKELNAQLSDIYFAGKDYHKASKVLIRAIRLYPDSPRFYKRLGDIKSILNREREAVDAYTSFLKFKCKKESLTLFVNRKFKSYLALEIISDLVKKEKKINYSMLIKELNTVMTGHLINQCLLGKLNRAKKKAYQNFSNYFINDVLISIAQDKGASRQMYR